MNLSTVHRKVKGKGKGKQAGSKPPRKLGPADATVYTREDGPTAQLRGDSEVAGKWKNCKNSLGQKYQEKNGMIQKTLHQWWKKKIAKPTSKIDDHVRQSFGNTIQRPITGPMWEPKDRGKLLLTGKVMVANRRQSHNFGMAVARTMVKVVAV